MTKKQNQLRQLKRFIPKIEHEIATTKDPIRIVEGTNLITRCKNEIAKLESKK